MVRIVSVQFASEDDTDGMSKAIGQIKLGACQAGQGEPRTLFGEEIECIVAEDMCGTSARKQADEMERKPLLHCVKMRQECAAINLMNVHGRDLALPIAHQRAPPKNRPCSYLDIGLYREPIKEPRVA
jgi:hypothetical protein